ncbi:MAG TPA: tetratricopeptide repeat protein [Thermoanaerobaculia bacterium]|nr:tetratricopeptide repeat protein [Thermoanaerobaculia bacterium]
MIRSLLPLAMVSLLAFAAATGASGQAAPDAAALFAHEEWEKALAAYQDITAKEPGNAEAWFRLGFSAMKLGKHDLAASAFAKAEAGGYKAPRLFSSQAVSLAQLGKKDEAFASLDKAIEAGMPVGPLDSNPGFGPLKSDPRFKAAYEKAERASLPCKYEPESKQFDFWLGEWDVFAQGSLTGHSRIEALQGGCLIVENYSNLSGYAGKSMNFYDPALGKWRQIWVDNGGTIIWFQGTFQGGSMVFDGEQQPRGGEKSTVRMTFTPNPDGSVRQLIEDTADGGKTWTPSFDGKYVPKKG